MSSSSHFLLEPLGFALAYSLVTVTGLALLKETNNIALISGVCLLLGIGILALDIYLYNQ